MVSFKVCSDVTYLCTVTMVISQQIMNDNIVKLTMSSVSAPTEQFSAALKVTLERSAITLNEAGQPFIMCPSQNTFN